MPLAQVLARAFEAAVLDASLATPIEDVVLREVVHDEVVHDEPFAGRVNAAAVLRPVLADAVRHRGDRDAPVGAACGLTVVHQVFVAGRRR